jgi:hypothetical protein
MDEEKEAQGGGSASREAAQLARVALIVSAMALAIAILGLFLPL